MLSSDQSNHNQAINNLIASIALQESFFSDVIYNESQRLNNIVNSQGITPDELYNAKLCLDEISQAISGLYKLKSNFLNQNFHNEKNLQYGGFII